MEETTELPLRIAGVSLDCADPRELGTFYRRLLGGETLWANDDSVGIRAAGVVLIAQRVSPYTEPGWPGVSIVHLDLAADPNLESALAAAIRLGARPVEPQPDHRWRVLLDPAGHPFCITTVTPD
jgi:hypothetical protein